MLGMTGGPDLELMYSEDVQGFSLGKEGYISISIYIFSSSFFVFEAPLIACVI